MVDQTELRLQLSIHSLLSLVAQNTFANNLIAQEILKTIPNENRGLELVLLAATIYGNKTIASQLIPLAGAEKILPKILWLLQQKDFYLTARGKKAIVQALISTLSVKSSLIPPNILGLMQEKKAYFNDSERNALYQETIESLCGKKDVTFDDEVEEKLREALCFMILSKNVKEEANFFQLIDAGLCKQVNREKLLLTALSERCWALISRFIKTENFSNIPSVFFKIQQAEQEVGGYFFGDSNYESARKSVIAYLSKNELAEHSETERRALQDVLTLVIRSTYNLFDTVKPIFLVPNNIKALNIDEFLSVAIEVGHGVVVAFMIEKGARNVARSFFSLGEQTTASWAVNQVVRTWKSGSHQEAYQALFNKILGLDDQYFSEENSDELKALSQILNHFIEKKEHDKLSKILESAYILLHLPPDSLFTVFLYFLKRLEKRGSAETEEEIKDANILQNICKKILLGQNEADRVVEYIIERNPLRDKSSEAPNVFGDSINVGQNSGFIQHLSLGISILFREENFVKQIKNKLILFLDKSNKFLVNILFDYPVVEACLEDRDYSMLLGFAITDFRDFNLGKICIEKIITKQREKNASSVMLPTLLLDGLLVFLHASSHERESSLELNNSSDNNIRKISDYLIEKLNSYEAAAFENELANSTFLSNLQKAAQCAEYTVVIGLLRLIALKKITVKNGVYDVVLGTVIQNPDPLEGIEVKIKIANMIFCDEHNAANLSLKYTPLVVPALPAAMSESFMREWEHVQFEIKNEENSIQNENHLNHDQRNLIDLLNLCIEKKYFGIALAMIEHASEHGKTIDYRNANRNLGEEGIHFAYQYSESSSECVSEKEKLVYRLKHASVEIN